MATIRAIDAEKGANVQFLYEYVQGVRAHPPDKLPAVFEPAVTRRDAPVPRTNPPMWRRSASVRPTSRSTLLRPPKRVSRKRATARSRYRSDHFGNADADEERRSHSEARSRSLRLLARQSASPGFCLLRTSTSRRCALATAAATSRVTRDAQPTQLQRWKGTPHERLTPSQ